MTSHQVIYQVVDENVFVRGIFDDLELAKREVDDWYKKTGGYFQINEIPLNQMGSWSETLKFVYSVGDLQRFM